MSRIFISHIAPKDKILEYKLSSAACNFSYNLMSGGVFDKVYSILPVYVQGKKDFPNTDDIEYIYSSWRCGNRILRKLAAIHENITLFRKIERGSSIWLYNMTMLNVWLVILLRCFKPSVRVNVIVLDFTPGDKYSKFFLQQINKCHGRILLANSSLFNKTNSAILPGVTPLVEGIEYPIVSNIKNDFLLSGVLSENIAMLSMVLSAFSRLKNCTLHITGMIEDDALIREYASKYPNIIYHGRLSFKDYLQLMGNTPFLLSTRNPAFPENQCNFPSKIIEALLHNRIVVSTLHYPQLDGINYFEVSHDIDDFVKDIEIITSLPEDLLITYANQSDVVAKRFSTEVWNETMKRIEKLNE